MRINITTLFAITITFVMVNTGFAQIVDDSTHLEFGAFSTQTYTEDQFFDDSLTFITIDSSFTDQHQYDRSFRNGTFYQNLGSTVSPSLSLTFTPYTNVMESMAADQFADFRGDQRLYYHTKSPYSFLKYSQGILGDQVFEGMFTQNVNPQLNFGGEFYRGVSKKQFSTNGSNDIIATTWYFRGFASYYSKNEKYHALFDVVNHSSRINEQWGLAMIDPFTQSPDTSDFTVDYALGRGVFADAVWSDAYSKQQYREISFQQRYAAISSALGVYTKSRFRWDKRYYEDPSLDSVEVITGTDTSQAPFLYPAFRFRTDSTMDERYFNSLENEAGVFVKGRFWNATLGYMQQIYGYENNHQSTKVYGAPVLIRGTLKATPIEQATLKAKLDYGLHGTLDAGISAITKYGTIGYRNVVSTPYLMDNYLNSNHLYWENDFKKVNTNSIFVKSKYDGGKWLLETNTAYHTLRNFIYYGEDWHPHQHDKISGVLQSANRGIIRIGSFNVEQLATITIADSRIVQIPQYMVQSKIYFLGKISHKVMGAQIGVEVNWRSAYLGNAYLPLVQTFYVQDDYRNFAYPVVDLFGNFNLKTVDLFAKLIHTNQYIGRPGYMTTPYYPGKRLNFVFGVKWRFYD